MDRDTIAAVATPPGEGGIGIVRISGPGAEEILSRVFRRAGGKTGPWESHRMEYGFLTDGKARIRETRIPAEAEEITGDLLGADAQRPALDLEDRLRALLAQTAEDYEIILGDDGSPDRIAYAACRRCGGHGTRKAEATRLFAVSRQTP